jgi:hypothetical protein
MDKSKRLQQQLVGGQDENIHFMVGHKPALWRLPIEVLCQIFALCLPAETDRFRVSSKLAPILLTWICRRWREVAMNTPSLWCKLYVQVHPDRGDWRKAASYYSLWLKRSRERSLSLAIDCPPNGAAKLERLLRPYNTQISSLLLLSEDAAIAAGLFLQDLPALQKLKLQYNRCDEIVVE